MVLIVLCFSVKFCAQCMHLKFGFLSGRLLEKIAHSAKSAYGMFSLLSIYFVLSHLGF